MNKKNRISAKTETVKVWVLILIMAIVMAGCSSTETPAATATPAAGQSPAQTASSEEEPLEHVTLVWYFRQSEPNNAASVLTAVNEILNEKINTTLQFEFINPGDYDSKMQLAMSAGEEFDLSFSSTWTNNFMNNVSRGAYVGLGEYLDKFPDLKNLFSDEIWEAVTITGDIYAVPNKQIMNSQNGYWFRADLVEKYELDVHSVNSLQQLEPILQTIKDNEPHVYPSASGVFVTFREYQPMVLQFSGDDWLRVDPETLKVIDDSEELLERYKLMREWNQKGFFPPDVATLQNLNELIRGGRMFSAFNRHKPGTEAELHSNHGLDFVAIPAGDPIIRQSSVQSTVTAISSTSKNPERAIMLLDLLNKDKELYNMLVFGLEGQDYIKVADNRIETIEGGYYLTNWMVGNVFNSYLFPGQADDVWEETERMDANAIIDPFIGFVFDRTPVQNELARLVATSAEYMPILKNGLDDAEKVFADYQEKMQASGLERVEEEVESQLADWKAAQGD